MVSMARRLARKMGVKAPTRWGSISAAGTGPSTDT